MLFFQRQRLGTRDSCSAGFLQDLELLCSFVPLACLFLFLPTLNFSCRFKERIFFFNLRKSWVTRLSDSSDLFAYFQTECCPQLNFDNHKISLYLKKFTFPPSAKPQQIKLDRFHSSQHLITISFLSLFLLSSNLFSMSHHCIFTQNWWTSRR